MIYKIENIEINSSNIALPAMNYGQTNRYKNFEQVNYTINCSINEFIKKTQYWFKTFRAETIEDSKFTNIGDYPIDDLYKQLNYPTLPKMALSHINLLGDIIKFNDLDILTILTKKKITNKTNKTLYLINSLNWVEIKSSITLGGEAFLIKNSN